MDRRVSFKAVAHPFARFFDTLGEWNVAELLWDEHVYLVTFHTIELAQEAATTEMSYFEGFRFCYH